MGLQLDMYWLKKTVIWGQRVIWFDTESVEKTAFMLLESKSPYLGQDLGDLTIPRWEAKQVSGAPFYPPATCTQLFFCTTTHAFSVQCKPYSSEYLHKGHYTLSSFATMGAFLSPPRPSLFPAESPRASFFVDTFNKISRFAMSHYWKWRSVSCVKV